MAFLHRVPDAHSVGGFRRAARLRYAEAARAVEADDRLIGIYLAGYAAEMTLKAAYFRVVGKKRDDPVTVSEVIGVKKQVRISLGIVWAGDLHNLTQWAEVLVEERKARGIACSLPFASRLVDQVQQVAANWRVDLRYHENRPRGEEVAKVFRAVEWLIAHEMRLVR